MQIRTVLARPYSGTLDFCGEYCIEVWDGDEFRIGYHYSGFSGTMLSEELYQIGLDYPSKDGYTVKMI